MSERLAGRAATREERQAKRAALPTLGWREWVGLPDLGIAAMRAKVDTGARTSTLHADDIVPFADDRGERVRFRVFLGRRHRKAVDCEAPLVGRRAIRNSGGESEERCVIASTVVVGERSWPIELTLTRRDSMSFRMLVGRTAIRGRYRVDPGSSYRMGKPAPRSGTSPAGEGVGSGDPAGGGGTA